MDHPNVRVHVSSSLSDPSRRTLRAPTKRYGTPLPSPGCPDGARVRRRSRGVRRKLGILGFTHADQ
eukprot:3829711-Alexandrium_andersonii.AAC.1